MNASDIVGLIAALGGAAVILRTGVFSQRLGWAGALIGVSAIVGSAAIVENDPRWLFSTINAFAWLAYFRWIAAPSLALIRARDMPRSQDAVGPLEPHPR
jgi:hypothetical protein